MSAKRPTKKSRKSRAADDMVADFEVTAMDAVAAAHPHPVLPGHPDFSVDHLSDDRRRILHTSVSLPEGSTSSPNPGSQLEAGVSGPPDEAAPLPNFGTVEDWDSLLVPEDGAGTSTATEAGQGEERARRYTSSVSLFPWPG